MKHLGKRLLAAGLSAAMVLGSVGVVNADTASSITNTAAFENNTGTESLSGDFSITYTGHEVTTSDAYAAAPLVELRDADNNCIDFRFDNWGWTYTTSDGTVDFTDDQKAITLWNLTDGWNTLVTYRQEGMDFVASVSRSGDNFYAVFTEYYDSTAVVTWTYTVEFDMADDITVLLTTGEAATLTDIVYEDNSDGWSYASVMESAVLEGELDFETEPALTYYGDTAIVTDQTDSSNHALYVDDAGGANGSYAITSAGYFSGSDFSNGVIISMDIMPTSNTSDWNYLFSLGTTSSETRGGYTYIDATIGFIARFGDTYSAYYPGGNWVDGNTVNSAYNYFVDGGGFTSDTWYNLTFVYTADSILIYVDNVLAVKYVVTDTSTLASILAVLADEGELVLGAGASRGDLENFGGYIDNVKVYSVADQDDSVTFLGGSLRKDSDDYSTTALRFGYTIDVPDEATNVSWSWAWGTDSSSLTGSVEGVNYVSNEDGTITSNLVITDIPAASYKTTIYSQITVTYTLDGAEYIVTGDVESRSVYDVATAIKADTSASESDTTYCENILAEITE